MYPRQEEQPRPAFGILDSLLNGRLRPHLPDYEDEQHIQTLYIQEVCSLIGEKPSAVTADIIRNATGRFLRYSDVHVQGRDTLQYIKDFTGLISGVSSVRQHFFPASPLASLQPTGVKQAFFLFLIEKEYLSTLAITAISLASWTSQDLKDYSRRQVQLLKLLAVRAREYDTFIHIYYKPIGITPDASFSEALLNQEYHLKLAQQEATQFIVEFIKKSITLLLLKLQEAYEPYLKAPLLTEKEIVKKFFPTTSPPPLSQLRAAFPSSQGTNQSQVPAPAPGAKTPLWFTLFKDHSAATSVLQVLREEGMVATDGRWIKAPLLATMIALYNVLLSRGYMVRTNEKAETLAQAFNEQFHTSFGAKKWQPKQRETAAYYEEIYGLIPEVKA